jgi:hypothetical protein
MGDGVDPEDLEVVGIEEEAVVEDIVEDGRA